MATSLDSITVDGADPAALAAWWARVLGWPLTEHQWTDGNTVSFEFSVHPPPGVLGVPLCFVAVDDPKVVANRIHVDLRSGTIDEQRATVRAVEQAGAQRVDIGQGDAKFVVLVDPEGNEFCVLEPRAVYAHTGVIAAVVIKALDPLRMASFWAEATGWDVAASTPGYAALQQSGSTGPLLEFIATSEPHRVKNRWHLDVRPSIGGDRDLEVERLMRDGATLADVGQADAPAGEVTWAVLSDPEGNEFCVLRVLDA
jgi:predicted enzyme related to lactoylglutathione lyase